MPDSGKTLQGFQRSGHLAIVFSQQNGGESLDGLGFLRSQSTGAHNGRDFFERHVGQRRWCSPQLKQGRGHLIDSDVGALC